MLQAIRETDRPMRNGEVVTRTGLPKATVSRLMNTLSAKGYLRRLDRQGTYVPGEASARAGHAMIGSLQLKAYLPRFDGLLQEAGATARLEARVAGSIVPVFEWSAIGGILLTNGVTMDYPSSDPLTAVCFGAVATPASPTVELVRQLSSVGWCYQWHPRFEQLDACTTVRLDEVGTFALLLRLPQAAVPSGERLSSIGMRLIRVADAIANASL